MKASYKTCQEVSPECPVQGTTYGYYPTLAGNVILLVLFAICAVAQLGLGIKYRLRAFTFAVTAGCVFEAVGYIGRVMMNSNPWDGTGFKIQVICLIVSPSFLAAGIYLTLKHLILYSGAKYSRLRPALYTRIFISCDVISIIAQAAGGGTASSSNPDVANVGNSIILAGIIFQVVTMGACVLLALDYAYRLYKARKAGDLPYHPMSGQKGFKFYLVAFALAFLFIFIRSIYRIPEMAGGWGNPLMRNETDFMVLDGAMIVLASILMTIAHPGIFFPYISSRHTAESGDEKERNAA